MATWERELGQSGFVRIHRCYLVNVDRLREIRHRGQDPNDWEVKLELPVNRVLPVGRQYVGGYCQLEPNSTPEWPLSGSQTP
jgi:DNA-binding LytR/AlgR family response regulator